MGSEYLRDALKAPRMRIKPLVPEMLDELELSSEQMEDGIFCPELDMNQYRKRLSKVKIQELEERANLTREHAAKNVATAVSEHGWETDAWHDVFGSIRSDDRLRMLDKRPYEFVEKDADGKEYFCERIPDATIGLRAYSKKELENLYRCIECDCSTTHYCMDRLKTLSAARLKNQIRDEDCSLMVDGVWGETDLIFPFAIYEAKKRVDAWENAQDQVFHPFLVYLGMLDDLARDPHDVTKYQTIESEQFQMFGFVSAGPLWKVYVAYARGNTCYVNVIWEGDIMKLGLAFELICIVEQIQDFATGRHRQIVIRHLEPWLRCAEPDEPTYLLTVDGVSIEMPNRKMRSYNLPQWDRIKGWASRRKCKQPKIPITRNLEQFSTSKTEQRHTERRKRKRESSLDDSVRRTKTRPHVFSKDEEALQRLSKSIIEGRERRPY